jgi:hypothetical protein
VAAAVTIYLHLLKEALIRQSRHSAMVSPAVPGSTRRAGWHRECGRDRIAPTNSNPAAHAMSEPIEYLHGQPLTAEDLEMLRRQIESLDSIEIIDEEIRAIVARHWPHLLVKLPPPSKAPPSR